MEIDVDYAKSAQDNAQSYFERAKDAERRAKGAEKAALDLDARIAELEKGRVITKKLKEKVEREWYEKFNWFFTSSGLLAIGGRSAQQNDEINVKYFSEGDLFLHASVFGASAVVLKGGASAPQGIKEEAAQFAACFSSAWENGQSATDVFAAKRDQVSKSGKGYIAAGSFAISGEREWFKGERLELCAFLSKTETGAQRFCVAPQLTRINAGIKDAVALMPGSKKKSDAAKAIAERLSFGDIDYVMQHLPAGDFSVSKE